MRRLAVLLLFAGTASTTACELQEVTVVDFEDVVVAEVYVTLREPPGAHTAMAFLHGAVAGGRPDSRTFDDARLRIGRGDGLTMDLAVAPLDQCVDSQPDGGTGTCFAADSAVAAQLEPGDALDLTITLGGGATALGALTLPGAFALTGLGDVCRLPPDTTLDVSWSRSEGAWAYINETVIEGLPAALAGEGIEAEDPLYLLGLSVSAADTTVVFPAEFGVFDRFDLDQGLAVRLQQGLPAQTSATVSIAAVERNYVNWVRGGSFNPSGLVRVSSLRGDATGVFGGVVVREFAVLSSTDPLAGAPDCP
ncbi:MAG TPA: hypothetical protein VMM35_01820 [Longimicrobiales bacterium]|nr:hypothetical protein [Longimicrobiales bacterium]